MPHGRGTLVLGALAAARSLWGDGASAVWREHLSSDARRAFCDDIVLPVAWYPEAHFEELCDVAWRKLAQEHDDVFDAFIRRSVDSGWGVMHRALLRLATPQRLARRAPDVWRHDHTHGEMHTDLRESSGVVRVAGYPYARGGIMRRGQAEALRHILSHARVRDVRAALQEEDGDDFVVRFEWT